MTRKSFPNAKEITVLPGWTIYSSSKFLRNHKIKSFRKNIRPNSSFNIPEKTMKSRFALIPNVIQLLWWSVKSFLRCGVNVKMLFALFVVSFTIILYIALKLITGKKWSWIMKISGLRLSCPKCVHLVRIPLKKIKGAITWHADVDTSFAGFA